MAARSTYWSLVRQFERSLPQHGSSVFDLWYNRIIDPLHWGYWRQDAFGEGLREFDFLRGNEGYKGEWSRGERWTVQLRLWRGARARTARAALGAGLFAREAVKAARTKYPTRLSHTVKIGHRAAFHIGGLAQ